VLNAYITDIVPTRARAKNILYCVGSLLKWWDGKRAVDVTPRNCRAYADSKSKSAAGADLKYLQAALRHWHAEYAPLPTTPKLWKPQEGGRRERWLTRTEAARLLRAARRTPHLARMIIIGLRTGSRPGVCKALEWSWIDLEHGTMYRRPPGTREKGNKRTPPVKLGRKMLMHLRRWKRMDNGRCKYVVHYDGRPIDDPHNSWKQAIKRAGLLGDVTPHVLRHTRATWLMRAGVPLWEAAGSLGMSPRILEAVYGHHAPEHQSTAADV
jgi:integrase